VGSVSRKSKLTLALTLPVLLLFAPQLLLVARYSGRTYARIEDVPPTTYAVVFGAYVHADGTLSDAALERTEAAVRLYHHGRVERLFVSGTGRSNDQALVMAHYARERGVPAEHILVDGLGIDTHDTCRHFAPLGAPGVMVSQGYHLPRAMAMCERDGAAVTGLAANHLDILASRGSNRVAIYTTRAQRFARESLLTWSYLLGIYDRISREAEELE
jgi:SanA protein